VAKNNATVKPMPANVPSTITSRQTSPLARRKPKRSASQVNARMPIGLPATSDITTIPVAAPIFANGTPAFTSPNSPSTICTGTLN